MAVAQKKPSAAPLKDLYDIGEVPPLGHVPATMHAWAIRKERHGPPETGDAERGGADLADRRGRGAGLCHGRRRQLQRRLGRAWHSGVAARRPQASVPYRRLRCVRHRLGGRLEGAALERRRRSHHSLQSGRRRRRGVQRRRSAVVAVAAHLGLRDARRLVRAILPRAVAPADAQAAASELGRIRLLHAHVGHGVSHAVRPCAAHPQARRQCSGLGRLRRARRVRRAARRRVRRQRHRHRVRSRRRSNTSWISAPRASSTAAISNAGARCRRSARPNTTPG